MQRESEETASNIRKWSRIKTREALLRAQQLLPSSRQRQGRTNKAVFESTFAVFETKSSLPLQKKGQDRKPSCTGALQTDCRPVGTSVLLSWLLRTLGFYFCLGNQLAFTPYCPGTLHT